MTNPNHPPKPKQLDIQLTNELATTFQNPDGTYKDTIQNIIIIDNCIIITRKSHQFTCTTKIEINDTTIVFIIGGPIIPIADLNDPNSIDQAKQQLYQLTQGTWGHTQIKCSPTNSQND